MRVEDRNNNPGGGDEDTGAWRVAVMAGFVLAAGLARVVAETPANMPSIDLPNPYAKGVKFGELPDGHPWGGVIAVTPGIDGKSIWGCPATPTDISTGLLR